jgi:hypothetical protein
MAPRVLGPPHSQRFVNATTNPIIYIWGGNTSADRTTNDPATHAVEPDNAPGIKEPVPDQVRVGRPTSASRFAPRVFFGHCGFLLSFVVQVW